MHRTLSHPCGIVLKVSNALKFGALWAMACLAQADPDAAAPGAAPAAAPQEPAAESESRWRLGIAAGYGRRTNPLIQSDAIPVLIDLDIAWFGKRWFFDNGDIGFELLDKPAFTMNAVARVNTDRAFFAKTNTKYINFQYLAAGNQGSLTGTAPNETLPFKPPPRDYAVELGLETLFGGDWGSATVRAFRDVSGTHDGFEIGVDYDYRITRGRFSISPSIGVDYKSRKLNDYYWGVSKEESNATVAQYHADGGIGWQAGLRSNYFLTKSVRLALSANYERLESSVADSPLVKDDYVLGYFGGIAWTF